MEKIQQALERAKEKRQELNSDAVHKSQLNDVQSINYTITKTVDVNTGHERKNRLLSAIDHNEYVEAFRILSTQVMQRMEENHWNTLAITSVAKGEGKTTTAINLGISISREIEYTTLLVDANLRAPELHKYFGVNPDKGLSDYLQEDIDLSELLLNPSTIGQFVILPAGKSIKNSTEMLGSPKMCDLVKELKDRYPKRIVIFDLPPIINNADSLSFLPCVDCVLLVVEDDMTNENDLKHAIELLSMTNIIGTVLNKAKY